MPVKPVVNCSKEGDRMDAQCVSRLNEIGMVRLVSLLGNSLAAVCVLATVVGGCTPPYATARRDGITSGSPSADQSDSAAPRFAQGGPDAEEHGASKGYPIGDRSSFFRIPFLVGSQSHLDQIFESRLIRRAATPSRLARVNTEPALRYEFGGETRTLDDYLARNPATGLLIARGDTILIERYQYAGTIGIASLVVDGQDHNLHAGRHRHRGRPHPFGG
jgi:hypothetical protein